MLGPERIGVSIASLPGYGLAEACALAHELGFVALEFIGFSGYRHSRGQFAGFFLDDLSPAAKGQLLELAGGFDHLSLHAPFFEAPLLSPDPMMREVAVHRLREALRATAFVEGSIVVSHASLRATYTLDESWDELLDAYRRLGDEAGDLGVRLTIETGFPAEVERFAELVHAVDHPAVGGTVDVGHLTSQVPRELVGRPECAAAYNDLLERHLRSLGDKLWHFHLHDVRAHDLRDHRACGRGLIDYARLLRVADELGFGGQMVFELEEEDIVAALQQSNSVLEAALP